MIVKSKCSVAGMPRGSLRPLKPLKRKYVVAPSLPTPSLVVRSRGDDLDAAWITSPSSSAVCASVLDVRATTRQSRAVLRDGTMKRLEIEVTFYFALVIIF